MTPPATMPFVQMNMAMSADGKISTRRRETISLGTSNDRLLMDELRARTDAVIIGAGTLRVDGFPLLVRNNDVRKKRVRRGLDPHPVNVLLSRSLDIPVRRPFFSRTDTRKLVYTLRPMDVKRGHRLSKHAEIIPVPKRGSYLKHVLSDLRARGMNRVLVEGGGELNFSFFREGLVNEIYLTVTPRIIGGESAPTVADGRGFLKHDHLKLELNSVKRIGDEVYLKYRVESAGG